VLFGPEPAACVDRLRGLGDQLAAIKGNTDRYVIDRQDDVDRWADALGEDRLSWLDALPAQLALPEQDALLVHATPRGDEEMLMPETPASEAAAILAGVGQRTLFCGHVHIQYRRSVAGHDVINPGSVGMPLDGDCRAAWAIVSDGRVELRRTAYDVETVADRVEREDGSFADMVARRLRTARRD
jgi:diadenosine tetraphosphatase ApaH/serine/threonine PP2A family protein phosphatase